MSAHIARSINGWVCCFMLRQQDYNADTYEIRVAGSRTFASTFEKLA